MPITLHKILVHSCDIINAFDMPIGLFSEDALESSHKEFRKHRLMHTRKISRAASNKDLMFHLCLSSDPLLTSKRCLRTRKMHNFDEIKEFLIDEFHEYEENE